MTTASSQIVPSLEGAGWLERAETRAVFAALQARSHTVRAVGGAVRNSLIGRPVADIDMATDALPEEVMELAGEAGLKVAPTGLKHGTVTVISDGHPFEVTTLRRDVATDGRRAEVAYTGDWAGDAGRRDFTMNALYCDGDGTVHDPVGGYADLMARRVRFIGEPAARIAEDYLRILRFFRFHAEYGEGPPDPDGLVACVRARAGLARLSAERIRAEMLKLLVAPRALDAIGAMLEHGLLVEVVACAPRPARLARLAGIEAAHGLAPSPARRLGALCLHVAEDARRLADRLRLSAEERRMLETMGADAPVLRPAMAEPAAKAALYAIGAEAWPERVLALWSAQADPADDAAWVTLLQLPGRWSVPSLPVRGADLLAIGIAPGKAVGELLRQLEDEWIDGGFVAGRGQLLARARELKG